MSVVAERKPPILSLQEEMGGSVSWGRVMGKLKAISFQPFLIIFFENTVKKIKIKIF